MNGKAKKGVIPTKWDGKVSLTIAKISNLSISSDSL